MRVAIIGGGIGGMALALSLHAAGLADVTVYESAPAIRELGVGINLLPHSVRELTELGLLDALLAAGIPTGEYVYCTKRGQEIWHEPLGVAAGYRWPQVSIQRGEMWRGVTPGAPFLAGRTMLNAGASRQRVVVYPISRVAEERGAALINWVATQRTAVGGPLPPQDWTFAADRTAVLDAFAPFAFAFLDVPALIREAAAVYQYPMVDRDPLPTWDFGRVTLLGDAAHPMHPVGGNGASQAILDARVLARALAVQPTIEAAVTAYDGERRPATAAVVSREELAAIADEYKRTAGFDIARLNERPSLFVR